MNTLEKLDGLETNMNIEDEEDDNESIVLIDKNAVKRYALEFPSAKVRGFERVGKSFLARIEAKTRDAIRKEIECHPSCGKTLK